jgi:DtxR family Mn-dependent transcriptional regulator
MIASTVGKSISFMTDSSANQSKSVEDFLKTVFVLQQQMERVSTNALANALNISPPTVTDRARRMVDAGLVDYRKYYGVVLTHEGEQIALRVIRRHRLIELYLVEELGYGLHEVHDEAEKLEHAVSGRFVEAVSNKLGNPEFDPHGDPIPTPDGVIARREMIALTDLETGVLAKISRLIANNPDMLQHILDRGFALNAMVKITGRDPFDGPVTAEVNGEERVIGHNSAACVLVEIEGG